MFRKILTVFIFVLFILPSIPVFFATSLSYTVFSSSFYRDTLLDTAYDPLVESVVSSVHGADPEFQKFISREDLSALFKKHFTKELFVRLIDDTSARFVRDVERTSPAFADKKMRIIVDYRPLQEPTKLFIRDLTRKIGGRVGYSNEASEKQLFEKVFPPSKDDFTLSVPLGVSRQEVSFLVDQFQKLWLYTIVFLLAFALLIFLTWIPNFREGVAYTGLMWATGGFVALLLSLLFINLDSIFATDIDAFVKSNLRGVSNAAEITDSIRGALHVLTTAFAKIYALVCTVILLLGGGVYVFGKRLLKSHS